MKSKKSQKSSQQRNPEAVINEHDQETPKERQLSAEENL